MKVNIFERLLSNTVAENRLYKFIVICLTAAFFWMGFNVRYALHHQRTILIPAYMDSRVNLTDGYASPQYIVSFARIITDLAFTYTSGTARAQYGELLQYFAPNVFTPAKKSFYDLADSIERTRLSSMFVINAPIVTDTVKHQIIVTGILHQWADVQPITPEQKAYIIEYQMFEGRFQVISLTEKKDAREKTDVKPANQQNIKLEQQPTH